MVVTSRHIGGGGGGEEAIVEFAPLLSLGFRPLMFVGYCGLSMGTMGGKDRLGIVWVARG